MNAQFIYDLRDARQEFDGLDLHALFSYLGDGDPSPSGHVEVDEDVVRRIAAADAAAYPWIGGGDPIAAARAVARQWDYPNSDQKWFVFERPGGRHFAATGGDCNQPPAAGPFERQSLALEMLENAT